MPDKCASVYIHACFIIVLFHVSGGKIRKKLVIVGGGAVGKECLVRVFSTNKFKYEYVPCIFETYVADIEVDGKQVCGITLYSIRQKVAAACYSHRLLGVHTY